MTRSLFALLFFALLALRAATLHWETDGDIDAPAVFYVQQSTSIPGNWITISTFPVTADASGLQFWQAPVFPSPDTNTFYRVALSNFWSGAISTNTNVPRFFRGEVRNLKPTL